MPEPLLSGGLRADLATASTVYSAPCAGFWVAEDESGTLVGSVAIRPCMRSKSTDVNAMAAGVGTPGASLRVNHARCVRERERKRGTK